MSKRGVLSIIERIVQVITIISGFLAIINMINNFIYEKKLQVKAREYLAEELDSIDNVKYPILVDSPKTKQQKSRIQKLLFITGVGTAIVVIFRVLKSIIND